ncbi:MAG: HD domain-containing protein [Deltaproteobacteria bacterium]|nr:MAG: HD domain-containing protein [Deltaproteobacteria bacterium]
MHLQGGTEIRCPVHGAIAVTARERAVVDHPFVQRLRGIRQLGFSHLPFPGATHSRYSHSVGAMHVAGLAFDACFRDHEFSSPERADALRSVVRLAALCHDLGHAPFSHAAEFAMPPLRDLGIDAYRPEAVAHRLDSLANHEDYTIAILTRSGLADVIAANNPFTPRHVAALICPAVEVDDDFFIDRGLDHRGLLSQLISSELDVDRMDYLVRDSLFTGARYGEIDTDWLVGHMSRHVDEDGRVCLALDRRAIYAFDDFLIARFHMFLMVYFHQKSIAYEKLLERYMGGPAGQEGAGDYALPADLDAYLRCDDAHLVSHLRRSSSPWARRIVEQRPYRMLIEAHGHDDEVDLSVQRARLVEAGIDVIEASTRGVLARGPKTGAPPIYVLDRPRGLPSRVIPLQEATRIFDRYQDEHTIARLYVPPERIEVARGLVCT